MKHSSNSYKHNLTVTKQPRNSRNRTPIDRPCAVSVYERFNPLADLLRIAICALATILLIALLVPVVFAADERASAAPVADYIPVVSTATEPVLTFSR